MVKSCNATTCAGSQSSPSPSPPKSNRGTGGHILATASIDTIDESPSFHPLARSTSTPHSTELICPPCPPSVAGPSGTQKKDTNNANKSCASDSPNTSELTDEFMDILASFMQQSYLVVKSWKETSGKENYSMSDTERMNRIQELLSLIAQKEAELSALEAQRDALGNSTTSSPALELSSYYRNLGQSSTSNSCDASCQAPCSPSSVVHMSGLLSTYSDINTADIMSPGSSAGRYSSYGANNTSNMVSSASDVNTADIMSSGYSPPSYPQNATYTRTPPNSSYSGYSPQMANSMQNYACDEECDSPCNENGGDILNTAFYDDSYKHNPNGTFVVEDLCDSDCNDTSGDLNSAFIDYESQKYTPLRPPGYEIPYQEYSPPPRPSIQTQIAHQRYASPDFSPNQYTQSYTQAASNVPTRSSMTGRSVSSCYCPLDLQQRTNKKR